MLSPDERLSSWRDFRKNLNFDDSNQAFHQVLKLWSSAPITAKMIDPLDQYTWPTVWEILHMGAVCENSTALGIGQTIYYADQTREVEFLYVNDRHLEIEKLCALIDQKYLFNLEYTTISNYPNENYSILHRVSMLDII